MKKILIIFSSLFISLVINCKNTDKQFMDKHNVILYNSPEFKNFEAKAKIGLKEAWDLQKNFAQNKNENSKTWLFFVIDGNYAFTSIFQPKIPEASTGGIWVNSETGEVKEIKSDVSLRYKDAYNGDGKDFFF